MQKISPKYRMSLMEKTEKEIWKQYESYNKVEIYLKEFQTEYFNKNGNLKGVNFSIQRNKEGKPDVMKTLSEMPQDVLFTVAIDMGIPVPMILPSFPTFKRDLTYNEKSLSHALEMINKAYKTVNEEPAQSIILANSALESIIKYILEDERIAIEYNHDTLSDLTKKALKVFNFYPSSQLQKNIKTIGSSLLCISQEIENIRSDKTFAHGKGKDDYIIDSNIYSFFVLNSVTTIGMFLISFYNAKYPPIYTHEEIPF